jgi:hypothetical protein
MTSVAGQRITKHASLITEAVFSVGSWHSSYKDVLDSIEQERTGVVESRIVSSFGTPACRDMTVGVEELN